MSVKRSGHGDIGIDDVSFSVQEVLYCSILSQTESKFPDLASKILTRFQTWRLRDYVIIT